MHMTSMIKQISLFAVACVAALAAAESRPAYANAPESFPANPPKGRAILWGAESVKPGSPMTYQLSYVADDAILGKTLQVAVRRTVKIEKEVLNTATGQMEKKKSDESNLSFIPITIAKHALHELTLPEPGPEYQTEIFLAATNAKFPEATSNSLILKRRDATFTMPEIEEVQKTIAAIPVTATAVPKARRKVLIYTKTLGYPHDSIQLGARTVLLMGEKTGAWEAVISNDRYMFEPEILTQFDAVMMMNTTGPLFGDRDKAINDRLRKSLLDFVEGGKGIAGCHAATDCSYDWPEYGAMMGGYFQGHPFGKVKVRIEDPVHPINAGFKGEGFEISEEMYTFKDPYSRNRQRILLSIDIATLQDDPARPGFKKGENRQDHDYAISWVREAGKGRVFYCSFGHQHHIWWNPKIIQHFLDGMQYVLGDLKANATPNGAASK